MNPPTNAERLREIMAQHNLTQAQVAELAGVSLKTVEGWLANTEAASFRNMPDRHIALISVRVTQKKKARRGQKGN